MEKENLAVDKNKYPRVMAELMDVIHSQLKQDYPTQNDEDNQKIARSIITALCFYCGGRDIYLPRGHKLKIALRDEDIYRQWGKLSIQELAQKHDLSNRVIYLIIEKQRALRRSKLKQGKQA